MKKYAGFLFILVLVVQSSAQLPDSTRVRLHELLSERQKLFSTYSESLKEKSGIFGNRTKRNLQQSHDYLLEIVNADNKIISVLNRALDYRNFERLNMTYDARDNEERIDNLIRLNESLTKQADASAEEIKVLKKELTRYSIYLTGFLLIICAACFFWIRNRFFRN